MFDLEKSIADWRNQMLTAGIKTPAPLEELEIHLREDIEQQMQFGSDVEKAFESAVQKIGRANVLKMEFKKTGGIIEPPIWQATFAFVSFAFFVAALFCPIIFGLGYMCVVTASVWGISKIIAVSCFAALSAVVLTPIFGSGAKSWYLPFFFGLIILVLTIGAAVYTFTMADRFHVNLYFHPYGLMFLAGGASFCIFEGLMMKPRGNYLMKPAS
jgi:hypothetical protein